MSNPQQNYYSINNSYNVNNTYRYFGRDLTNFEGNRSSTNSNSRDFKIPTNDHIEPNYSSLLRNSRYLQEDSQTHLLLNNFQNKNEKLKDSRFHPRTISSQHRRTSSMGIHNSQFLNPRISNFSNIDDTRNIQNGNGLSCYYVANQLKGMVNYGMRTSNNNSNYGSKRSLNLNVLKNSNSPVEMSRNLSREHVAEITNCGKIENKLNEYILNSRRNSNLLRDKRSQGKINVIPRTRQSFERPPIQRNGSSFQISNSQYESQKYGVSSRISQRVESTGPLMHNYFAVKKYQMPSNDVLGSRKNSSRRASSASNNDFRSKGIFLRNSFTEIANEISGDNIGYTYSNPVKTKSEFEKEMTAYKLEYGDPGADFVQGKGLNMPNVWNYLDKNIHNVEYIKSGIQIEVTERMRGILIDWLIDVHKKFRLRDHTLFIAVNLIDRSLEKFYVKKSNFQLLGITCLFIASKYEEIYPPAMSEYTYVCADAYKDRDLLDMEAQILNALNFDLVFTSSLSIFKTYSQERRPYHLAQYLLHISLLNSGICRNNSCDLTASVFLLISKLLGLESLTEEELIKDFDCDRENLRNLSQKLFVILCEEKNSKLSAARRKFDQSKYMSVSAIQVSVRNDE